MDQASVALAACHILCGAVVILISVPLLKRQVGMNRWYGIRFKKSFESEDNWYRINAYGAKRLILWSFVLLLIGVATLFVPLEGHTVLAMALACAPLILLVPAVESYLYARKL